MSTTSALTDLRPLTTFGLPAVAEVLYTLTDETQLPQLLKLCRRTARWCLLGGGSNTLFTEDFSGCVIRVALKGRGLQAQTDDAWLVRAAAGENWHELVLWTLVQGWPGLENLALIPGTVGAAPVQNIGAYGLELAERVHSVEAVNLLNGERRQWTAQQCAFAYRDSLFKQPRMAHWLITAVTLRLPRHWQPVLRYAALQEQFAAAAAVTPQAIADAVIALRRSRLPDPAQLGNVGSFFHNPRVPIAQAQELQRRYPAMPGYPYSATECKLAAGWLIEQCGWRGRALGRVGCYQRQALVLVNLGQAQADELIILARAIQHDVYDRFGVQLMPEPKIFGASGQILFAPLSA